MCTDNPCTQHLILKLGGTVNARICIICYNSKTSLQTKLSYYYFITYITSNNTHLHFQIFNNNMYIYRQLIYFNNSIIINKLCEINIYLIITSIILLLLSYILINYINTTHTFLYTKTSIALLLITNLIVSVYEMFDSNNNYYYYYCNV